MAENITTVPLVGESVSHRWNVTAVEYDAGGGRVDFQDLLVSVAEQRAFEIEGEIEPLAVRVQSNNRRLEKMGKVLAELSSCSTKYDTEDDPNPSQTIKPSNDFIDVARDLHFHHGNGGSSSWSYGSSYSFYKADCDEATQLVETEEDRLNNQSSLDTSRLQSIVSYRDQTFQTASSLMTDVNDTRSRTIQNMG